MDKRNFIVNRTNSTIYSTSSASLFWPVCGQNGKCSAAQTSTLSVSFRSRLAINLSLTLSIQFATLYERARELYRSKYIAWNYIPSQADWQFLHGGESRKAVTRHHQAPPHYLTTMRHNLGSSFVLSLWGSFGNEIARSDDQTPRSFGSSNQIWSMFDLMTVYLVS